MQKKKNLDYMHRLPKKVSNDLINMISNPMRIKSDDGRIWFVDWKWDNGFISLEGNYSDLVQILGISQGDILFFITTEATQLKWRGCLREKETSYSWGFVLLSIQFNDNDKNIETVQYMIKNIEHQIEDIISHNNLEPIPAK